MKGRLGYKVRTIKCDNCGQLRTDRFQSKQIFCSTMCARHVNSQRRKTGQSFLCAVCGVYVYIPKSRLGLINYFCSQAHANEWQGRNKTTHTCKVCGRSFRLSPSVSASGRVKYCSIRCRDVDPEHTAHLVSINADQQSGKTNRLEVAGYKMLDELGFNYKRQYLVGGRFCVDAFIVSVGVVVQFDGDYWHGHPTKFPEPNARQHLRIKLDKSQDAYMLACGYDVFRVWESDMKNRVDHVRSSLLQLVADRALNADPLPSGPTEAA